MPTRAALFGTGLVSSIAYPYTITVGGMEISQLVDLSSIVIEETATESANGLFSCRYWDATNSRPVTSETVVQVYDDTIDQNVFLGTVRRSDYQAQAVGRYVWFEAVEISSLLDRILVPLEIRPFGEGTAARFAYFWGKYARSPFSGDLSQVANVDASLASEVFANLTLRQALQMVADQSGSSVRWYVDSVGRPHLFAGTESNPGAAPFNVNVAIAPGGGNIAPDDLSVERDGNIINRFYVRGATEAGSGWYGDSLSQSQYGVLEDWIDAPSADDAEKARNIAQLQLGRVAQPNIRGRFTTTADGWRAGQNITITSAQFELSAYSTRIVKVMTRFLTGTGRRTYNIEFSDTGARLGGAPAFQGLPAQIIGGTLGERDGAQVFLGNAQVDVNSRGVVVSDGVVERVLLGQITPTDYGLRVTNGASVVIIDGTSNMFKIVAQGELTFFGPVGALGAPVESTTSTDLATGQNYTPVFLGFQESFDGTNNFALGLPRTIWLNDGTMVDYYGIRVYDLAASSDIRVTGFWAARGDRSASSTVLSYFVLKEQAF